MKIRYPQATIAIAIAAFLAVTCAAHVYAVDDSATPGSSASTNTNAAKESENALWKAEISDYDSSLSLVQYEEVTPTEDEINAIEAAMKQDTTATDGEDLMIQAGGNAGSTETLASSNGVGSVDAGAAIALGVAEAGQFTFTTYGYGHGVGLSQNGANYYASYGGYDYQSILFHYYPGTTLVQEDTTNTIGGSTEGLVNVLAQIVYNEMSSVMHPEAMKAQAVAAYTYIMCNGGSTSGLVLKPNPPQNVVDAVASVAGQALYYDGNYAMTVYGASSGGATADSRDIFGTNYPYLVSVPCEYDALYDPNYGEITSISVDTVRSCIESAYGISLSADPSNWFQLELGSSGYVRYVHIDGQKTVSGFAFSNLLGLKSARFAYTCG